MRLRLILVVIVLASAGLVTQASASPTGSVPVVRCPTKFGAQGTSGKSPASLAVLGHPSSIHGLAAYTNFEEFLVAPAGMKCSGEVGVDGNGSISVWPPGHGPPTEHSHYEGLTLALDPACASCRAADACPFFPKFAASLSFPCSTDAVPPHEQAYDLTADTTLFEDPPGVAGDGWPSGGPDPANGIVGFNVNENSSVYRSTCTLPQSEHWICTVSLNDVYARYGQSGSSPHPTTPAQPTPSSQSSTLDARDFNGGVLAVSASLFGDPATPANQFYAPSSGDKLIAIQLKLRDLGLGTVSDDADVDTTLVGSDDQVYTTSADEVQGCTNFDYGQFTLSEGQSEIGCVVFEVPGSVAISRVEFTLGVNTIEWNG